MKKSKAVMAFLKRTFPEEMKRVAQGRCPFCGQLPEVEGFRDEVSRREYEISGICQHCQDDYFGGR